MISFLRGRLINKGINYVILETHDLGYRVFVGEALLNDSKVGMELELYTHQRIKEDASDLYGFKSISDLELFELLLTVSGVGPKSALGVLNIATASDIQEAIIRGDADLLTKVAGIGKKTAERLVLELKNKIIRTGGAAMILNSGATTSGDEIDALMSLGYSLSEARSALNLVDSTLIDSGARVKAALKSLVRK